MTRTWHRLRHRAWDVLFDVRWQTSERANAAWYWLRYRLLPYRVQWWLEARWEALGRFSQRVAAPILTTTCEYCGRLFDRRAKGAMKPNRSSYTRRRSGRCPLCTTFTLDGAEAWAVKNDCNGIFDDMVVSSKAEAEEMAAKFDPEIEMYAVPVRVYEDPEPAHRGWQEDQWRGAA